MKMMKEDRGLTLVELVITIAIVAIVIAAATSFMITGSRSFTKGSADSDLQKEAELTVNQIEDMVIDVNGGMEVNEVTDTEGNKTKTELVMYHATEEPGESGVMETKYVKETVVWDKNAGDDRMFYSKWNVNYDTTIQDYVVDGLPIADNELLAENVSMFEVDVDAIDKTAYDGTVYQIVRSVQIRVGYENSAGRVDYATSPVITLRNRMLLSGNPAEIFDEPPTVSANMVLWYYGDGFAAPKKIEDRVSEVQRGKVYDIYAYLDNGDDPGYNVNHLVNWEIEEANSNSVINSDGILTVFPTEPNEFLTIIARYKTNPNKYAIGVVKVVGGSKKSLTAVTITPRWAADDSVTKPFEPLFSSYPTLEPSGAWTTEEIKNIQYTWTFDVPERVESRSPDSQRDKTGQFATLDLKIKKEKENYGKILTIWLTAYSPDTGQTVVGEYKYRIDPEGTVDGESTMQRGLGVGPNGENWGHNKINCVFDTEDSDRAEIKAYFCDVYGNERTDVDPSYIVLNNWNRWRAYYTLSFKRELPMDKDYYVKVVATFEKDIWEWDPNVGANVIKYTKKWSYERIHYIPGVQMYDYHMSTGNKKGEFEFNFGLVAYWNVALQDDARAKDMFGFKVIDLQCEQPEGVNLNVTFGGPVSTIGGADDMMHAWGFIHTGDTYQGALPNNIIPKSITVRIYMKQYEDVYTDITIYFDN